MGWAVGEVREIAKEPMARRVAGRGRRRADDGQRASRYQKHAATMQKKKSEAAAKAGAETMKSKERKDSSDRGREPRRSEGEEG